MMAHKLKDILDAALAKIEQDPFNMLTEEALSVKRSYTVSSLIYELGALCSIKTTVVDDKTEKAIIKRLMQEGLEEGEKYILIFALMAKRNAAIKPMYARYRALRRDKK